MCVGPCMLEKGGGEHRHYLDWSRKGWCGLRCCSCIRSTFVRSIWITGGNTVGGGEHLQTPSSKMASHNVHRPLLPSPASVPAGGYPHATFGSVLLLP